MKLLFSNYSLRFHFGAVYLSCNFVYFFTSFEYSGFLLIKLTYLLS